MKKSQRIGNWMVRSLMVATGLMTTQAFSLIIINDDEQPEEVWVDSVSAGGTGCQGGIGVDADVLQGSVLKLNFERAIEAEAGGGIAASESRKFCNVIVELDHTPGWSYRLSAYRTLAYAELSNATANVNLSYNFVGGPSSTLLNTIIRSPFRGVKNYFDSVEGTEFSPCNSKRALNIKTSVFVRPLSSFYRSYAYLTIDAPVKLLIEWKKCH